MDKYSLDELSKTFLEHAKECEKTRLEMLEKYPDNEFLKDDFNISRALASICQKLLELQCDIDILKQD